MHQDRLAPNVGRIDALVRGALAVAIIAAVLYGVTRVGPDWWLTVLLHPFIFAAYLLLTAVARTDLAYHLAGWDTRSRRARRAQSLGMVPPPSRGRRRPLA